MHKILHSGTAAAAMFSIGFSIVVPTAGSSPVPPIVPATVAPIRAAGTVERVVVEQDAADVARSLPSVSLHPTVVVTGASPEEQALVDEALALFAGAGLRLPDLHVVFADDPSECGGHEGLFRSRSDPWQVLVCSDLAFVVTHEFAHAWEAANLDDDDRAHYMERRGLPTWDSFDVEWGERGVEDMAFMVQQNLMAGHVDVTSDRWVERTDAYAWATGRRSPVLPVELGTSSAREVAR